MSLRREEFRKPQLLSCRVPFFMNESEILERCLKKDKKAWNLFVEKYCRLVYWAIRKRLDISRFKCDEADIEDIFQEVFLTILKGNKLLQLKNPKFIAGWLSMVASHKTVDFMRQKVHWEQSRERLETASSDNLVFKNDSFTQNLFDRDIATLIREIINTLSDKEKIIISLNLLEGRTHKEIARILRIPVNTVSTLIVRTKEKIKGELRKRGVENNF